MWKINSEMKENGEDEEVASWRREVKETAKGFSPWMLKKLPDRFNCQFVYLNVRRGWQDV